MTRGLIVLAAGGTGGHLFPAFALAEELRRRDLSVDLVTDERSERYGIDFPGGTVHRIPSATFAGRSPVAAARTMLRLGHGLRRSHSLIGKIRPRAVVGFGGYPTVPPLLAAALRGVPMVIHEQNAVMGRANRLLARRASCIAASFEATRLVPSSAKDRVRVTGNPVRDAVVAWSARRYEPPGTDGPIRLVAFGGSQGARYFSDLVPAAVLQLPEPLRRRLEIVQQCREEDLARTEVAYRSAGVTAKLQAFYRNLPEILASAHLVIGRAGASTVAELAVLGRPAILVPLPHALDNDQLHNAQRVETAGGGWCLEQKSLSGSVLAGVLKDLFEAPGRLAKAGEAARLAGKPDAVARLADLVEELARLR